MGRPTHSQKPQNPEVPDMLMRHTELQTLEVEDEAPGRRRTPLKPLMTLMHTVVSARHQHTHRTLGYGEGGARDCAGPSCGARLDAKTKSKTNLGREKGCGGRVAGHKPGITRDPAFRSPLPCRSVFSTAGRALCGPARLCTNHRDASCIT